MDEQDPLWDLLRQAPPAAPEGSLAARTLARLAVEKRRRRLRARLGRICALSLLLAAGGGGCAAWLVHHQQRQGAGWTRAAFASIEAHPGVEDARWLQEQLSAEPGEPGESILWEEPDSF